MKKINYGQLESLVGDELLDNNGILIPSAEIPFYNKEELASHKQANVPLKNDKFEDMLGLQIQHDPERLKSGNKRAVPYEIGLAKIKKHGYERYVIPSEIIGINRLARSGDTIAEKVYTSLKNHEEWLGLAIERRDDELIFYESPTDIFIEPVVSYWDYSKQSKGPITRVRYNSSRIICKDIFSFNIGNDKSQGMNIPLSSFGPALISYLLGIDIKDYPKKMPEPMICLPHEAEIVPIGFSILKDIFLIGPYTYAGFRGVRKK